MEFNKFIKTGEVYALDGEGNKEWDGDDGFKISFVTFNSLSDICSLLTSI